MSLAEILALDAGFRFEGAGGEHPYRGRGLRVPTFDEVLGAFPDVPLNVELKEDDMALVEATARLLEKHAARERVLLAAETGSLMTKIRNNIPGALTGMSLPEVLEFMGSGGNPGYRPRGFALQVPTSMAGLPIVTPYFVKVAHACKLEVHAWVINDEAEMRALVEMGVDGIMTDFPGLGARVLGRRAARSTGQTGGSGPS